MATRAVESNKAFSVFIVCFLIDLSDAPKGLIKLLPCKNSDYLSSKQTKEAFHTCFAAFTGNVFSFLFLPVPLKVFAACLKNLICSEIVFIQHC